MPQTGLADQMLGGITRSFGGVRSGSLEELPWEETLDPWTPKFFATGNVQDREQTKKPAVGPALNTVQAREAGHPADVRAARQGVDSARPRGLGQLIDLARTQLGAPYVFGSSGPDVFDCSGFVTWLYSRSFGVSLPHQAKQQAAVTKRISKKELAPGDLIFYAYGRLGNEIDHVEVYLGGNKQIGTSNPTEDLDIDNIDWGNVRSFGRVQSPNIKRGRALGGARRLKPRATMVQTAPDPHLAPLSLANSSSASVFGEAFHELFMPERQLQTQRATKRKGPTFTGSAAATKRQLYQGFVDAGREDLAKMVRTKDFDTWINAESGWRSNVVSKHYAGHGRNFGLFQFWQGHDWTGNFMRAGEWIATPYQQAQLVARHFGHLSPEDIRRYAAQIRAGKYAGWG